MTTPDSRQTLSPETGPAGLGKTASAQPQRRVARFPLRVKLTIAFLAVTLIPLALIAYQNGLATRQALINAANEKLKAAAEQTSASIDSFIQNNLSAIQTEAQLPELIDYMSLPPEQQRNSAQQVQALNVLHTLSEKNPYISSYALLDTRGLDVLDTHTADIDLNKFTSDFFQKPLETGQSYVSPLRFSATTNELAVYFSTPLQNAGEIIGILAVRYNAQALQKLVTDKTDSGSKSFAVLLDKQDYIRLADGLKQMDFKAVVPLAPERLAELKADGRLPDLAPEQLATNLPDFKQGLDQVLAGGEPYFAAELHNVGEGLKQSAVAPVKSQDWLVVFAQPQDVFLAPVAAQTTTTLITALVIAIIALLVALILARLLTNPITHLNNVAGQVAAGDLAIRAEVHSRDEIGVLADTFNSMTDQLQDVFNTLEQRIEARTEQLRTSADVGRAAASTLNPDQLLRETVNLISNRFGFYYAAIFTLDASGKYAVLREATGEAGRRLKENHHQLEVGGQSMVGQVVFHRKARIALDVGVEAVRFANPLLLDTRSEIALPLLVGDHILGALDVQSTQEAAFDETSAAVLQSMADQVAIAWNNALSYAEAHATALRSRALFAASREVGRLQVGLVETIEATLRAAADVLEYDRWDVLTFNEIRTALVPLTAHNWPGGEAALNLEEQADHPLVYSVQQDSELLISEAFDPRLRGLPLEDLRGLVSVPIKMHDAVVGVLAFSHTQDTELTAGDLEVGRSLANLIAVAIENHNLVETSQRTLRELDEINRGLTGQSWEGMLRRQGQRGMIWYSLSDQLQPQVAPEVSEALAQGRIATHPLADRPELGVAVPIKLRDVPVGALRLIVPRRTWNPEMAAALDSIAGHIAQAAENARLIAVAEERLTREQALAEATEKVRQRSEIEAILQTAAAELARYLNASHITVRMTPEQDSSHDNGHSMG